MITAKPAIRVPSGTSGGLARCRLLLQARLFLRSPALWPAFQEVGVVEEPIEHGRDGCRVAEQLAPVIDGCPAHAGPR